MLPGEPLSPAQSNAAAKVATITGAYQVARWTLATFFDPQDWSELNPEQLEFLSDWSVDREECNRDIIEDALWQFVRYENLSAEVSSGFYPAGSEAPEPTRWRVWLTIGGLAATSQAPSEPSTASKVLRLSAVGLAPTSITHRLTWSVRPWSGSRRSSSPERPAGAEQPLH